MKFLVTMALLLAAGSALAQTGSADRLWELYKEGRFEDVVREGKVELTTGTPTAQVNLAVGRALVDLGRISEGLPYLEQAVRGDPAKTWVYAWAQCYLGSGQYLLGNVSQAKEALINARDCAATLNSTRNAVKTLKLLGLSEYYDDWTIFTSKHFVFHFSSQLTDFDEAAFARRHEGAFETISAWFGGGPTEPIRFFVWRDKTEGLAADMPPLGFARPNLNLVHARANQTTGHEMTHVISQHSLQPDFGVGLINEGISVYHDQTNRDQMGMARKALKGDLDLQVQVALAALWEDWSLLPAEVSYPVAGAWVKVLIDKGGKEKFLEFFRDQRLANGRAVYGPDLQEWMDDFTTELYR